jgi:hypothetical protein
MSTYNYQVVYGNQLADDLHNLFPDIIYNPTRFTNVQDLLQYVQIQMRNRFDLFTFGRNMVAPYTAGNYPTPVHTSSTSAAASAPASVPPSAAASAPASTMNPSTPLTRSMPINPPIINSSRVYRQTAVNMNPVSLLSAFEMASDDEENLLSSSLLTNLLTPFFRSNTNPIAGLEPVIVRPTQTQITAATEVYTQTTANPDTCCTICQDDLPVGCQVRKIRTCGHQFHKNCIDQWFERNVRCPVCRHDIRDNTVSNNTNSTNNNSNN